MHEVSLPQHTGGNCLEGCPGEEWHAACLQQNLDWTDFVRCNDLGVFKGLGGGIPHAHTAGTTNLVVTVAAALYFGFATRQLNLGWIYDSYVPLMSAAIGLSFALSAGASHK